MLSDQLSDVIQLVRGYCRQQADQGGDEWYLIGRATQSQARSVSLESVRRQFADCRRCRLCATRTHLVFGSGPDTADIVFVGEAPGRDEDLQGAPFVGRAGQLLTRIIEAIGLRREDVYIGNILKCRPPENRDPLPDEMECCRPILDAQLRIIRPKMICALGRIAAQALLGTQKPLTQLRGRIHEYAGARVVVTYHPAALLRNPNLKRPTWEDMQMFRKEYDRLP
jgi:DNA polymerase